MGAASDHEQLYAHKAWKVFNTPSQSLYMRVLVCKVAWLSTHSTHLSNPQVHGLPMTHTVSFCTAMLYKEEQSLTSNEYRLEDGLLHRAAGYQISVVQHICREALQPVPDCWAQCGNTPLQALIGSLRRFSLDRNIKQSRCSRAGHLLLGPDQTLLQSGFGLCQPASSMQGR